jgi:serine/threonine-protein kinase
MDLLGVGGMGWVYRATRVEATEGQATDGKASEIVALKVLLDQFKNDQGMLARFEQECRAGLKFQHENIVRTLACGSAGGLPYVVMEYVEGPSLLELLRNREGCRLPWEQACDIARQAAKGLHHMHLAGFVHRDIKPQNLLIDRNGDVKLIDFGLSMRREGELGDEFSMAMIFGHECVGTAAYSSPEQAIDSLKSDARSDVYSLGCTLFAMLTGDTPFPYKDTNDVLKAHQREFARNVCNIVPSIPKVVGEIVAKMLMKK